MRPRQAILLPLFSYAYRGVSVNPSAGLSSLHSGLALRTRAGILDFSRDCGKACACRRPTGKAAAREIFISYSQGRGNRSRFEV